MNITKNLYDKIKIIDILALGYDLIVKYKLDNDDNVKTIPILMIHISQFFDNNLGVYLVDLLKYYLSMKKNIKILKIMKYKHTKFKKEDFRIKILTRRFYGNILLFYVNILNKRTRVIFEDWVRPFQIKSIIELNHLISWESEGDEIDFF